MLPLPFFGVVCEEVCGQQKAKPAISEKEPEKLRS